MANRETYPASQSPLTGDISGPAGAQRVTVTGIQGNPVDSILPGEQNLLTFDRVNIKWAIKPPGNMSVLLNGFFNSSLLLVGFSDISDDYVFSVNNVGLESLVGWALGFTFKVFVNGVGVV
jgi:hypothetical protein